MSDFARVLALWRDGRRAEAESAVVSLLAAAPDHIEGLRFLAELSTARGQTAEAARTLRRLAQLVPQDAAVRRQLGHALLELREFADAISILESAIALDPDNPRAYNNLGLAQLRAGDAPGALATLTRAVKVNAGNALAHLNLGLAQDACGEHAGARESYLRALALEPHLAQARLRLSAQLQHVDPGVAHSEQLRALESVAINLMTTGKHAEASTLLTQILDKGVQLNYLEGLRFHCELWSCEWSHYEARSASLEARVHQGQPAVLPFSFFVHSDSAEAQRRCAEIFVSDKYPARTGPHTTFTAHTTERITVAYLSSDLYQHATAYLVAGLLEAHDRARFTVIAASYGPDDRSAMRARLERAVDEFLDLRGNSDDEIAQILRARGVQIAVDLKGHTGGARTGILAQRPVPIQVNFLGYPGTMGAPYMDYIIADRHLIPPQERLHYTEQVLELPGCYQPNDNRRPRPPEGPGREACGLPAHGFVFCCFNHVYKVVPMIFSAWMRLLRAVEGSVLWLLQGSETARRNLRTAAAAHGIAPERLVFAPQLTLDRHLARYHHADLFLDTWPCNAHTTASDALWMGVPLITLTGRSFPSRVATSLLNSLGLGELCAASLAEYEALAMRLAQAPGERARLRARLEAARHTSGLFNTQQYCRRLEAAYEAIWSRHVSGELPAAFEVPDA